MNAERGTSRPKHVPVLAAEVLALLDPKPGEIWVDATVGVGGHSRLIAEKIAPDGRLIGLDQDEAMLDLARPILAGLPAELIHANFDQLGEILGRLDLDRVDGVLADLGVCSDQLDDAARGLTFQEDGPLDMRLDPSVGEPASSLIDRTHERALADLIYEFGEERFSRRIARRIVQRREEGNPVRTTAELAVLVRGCVPRGKQRIDPATRTFQALRIAVNDEMAVLDRLLAELPRCLKPGGRAGLISFHSLEDRRVKRAFRDRQVWEVLTKKPVTAGDAECRANPRARSAKFRAARREQSEVTASQG